MAFARVNGVVLHHELRGPQKAPAVVFSNSLGTDFRIWDEVADALAGEYRILLYDKRGHGLSDAAARALHHERPCRRPLGADGSCGYRTCRRGPAFRSAD